MKIIQVCSKYYPEIGGIETHVKELSEALVREGHEVEVVCTYSSGKLPNKEIIGGVKITRFWAFAPMDAYYFSPAMYFYLKNQRCNVIHAHNYHAFPALFAALAKNDRRLFFNPYFHGKGHTFFRNLLHMPYKLIGNYIINKSDRIICISRYEQKLICDAFHINKNKIKIIPPGLDLSEFTKIEPLQKKGKTILYVGRLEEYKGVQYIIEALPYLKGYSLEIIGSGSYENNLKNLAQKMKVTNIVWLKNVSRSDLIRYYKSADVFVMLSKHESYGIAVAESLACGTPCIVVTGSALDEFVDGKYCVGIKLPITINKLVKAVQQLEITDGKIDIRSLPLVDWNEVAHKLLCLYEGIK